MYRDRERRHAGGGTRQAREGRQHGTPEWMDSRWGEHVPSLFVGITPVQVDVGAGACTSSLHHRAGK